MSSFNSRAMAEYRASYGNSDAFGVGPPSQRVHMRAPIDQVRTATYLAFGIPRGAEKYEWDTHKYADRHTQVLPKEWHGQNRHLERTFVQGIESKAQENFILGRVSPLVFMDISELRQNGITWKFSRVDYNSALADRVGTYTVPRVLTFTSSEHEATIERRGLAIHIPGGLMSFPSGLIQLQNQIAQLQASFKLTVIADVTSALVNAPSQRKGQGLAARMGIMPSHKDLRNIIDEEMRFFAILGIEEHPLPLVMAHGVKVAKELANGVAPDTLVVPSGLGWSQHFGANENTYRGSGQNGYDQQYSRLDSPSDILNFTANRFGLVVGEAPDIRISGYENSYNALIRPVTVGELHNVTFENMRHPGRLPRDKNGIAIYNFDRDRLEFIPASVLERNCGLWDESGQLTPMGAKWFGSEDSWLGYLDGLDGDGDNDTLHRLVTDLMATVQQPNKGAVEGTFVQWFMAQSNVHHRREPQQQQQRQQPQEEQGGGGGGGATSGRRSRKRGMDTGARRDRDTDFYRDYMHMSQTEMDRYGIRREDTGRMSSRPHSNGGDVRRMEKSLVRAMQKTSRYRYGDDLRANEYDVEKNVIVSRVNAIAAMIDDARRVEDLYMLGPTLRIMRDIINGPGGAKFDECGRELDDVVSAMANLVVKRKEEIEAAEEGAYDDSNYRSQMRYAWDRVGRAREQLHKALRDYENCEKGLNYRYNRYYNRASRGGGGGDDDDDGDSDTLMVYDQSVGSAINVEELGQMVDKAVEQGNELQEDKRLVVYTRAAREYLRSQGAELAQDAATMAITLDRALARLQRDNVGDTYSAWREAGRVDQMYTGAQRVRDLSLDPDVAGFGVSSERKEAIKEAVRDVTREARRMDETRHADTAFRCSMEAIKAAINLGVEHGMSWMSPAILKEALLRSPCLRGVAKAVWGIRGNGNDDDDGGGREMDDDTDESRELSINKLSDEDPSVVHEEIKKGAQNAEDYFSGAEELSKEEMAIIVLIGVELGSFMKDRTALTFVHPLRNAVLLAGDPRFAVRYTGNRGQKLPAGTRVRSLRVRREQNMRVSAVRGVAGSSWVELHLDLVLEDGDDREMRGPRHVIVAGDVGATTQRSRGAREYDERGDVVTGARNQDIIAQLEKKLRSREQQAVDDLTERFQWAESREGVPDLMRAVITMEFYSTAKRHTDANGASALRNKIFVQNTKRFARITNEDPESPDSGDVITDIDGISDDDIKKLEVQDAKALLGRKLLLNTRGGGGSMAPGRDEGRVALIGWLESNKANKGRYDSDNTFENFDEAATSEAAVNIYSAIIRRISGGRRVEQDMEGKSDQEKEDERKDRAKAPAEAESGDKLTYRQTYDMIVGMLDRIKLTADFPRFLRQHGIRPVINYVIVKPFITVEMGSLVFLSSNGAMNTFVANPRVTVGLDAAQDSIGIRTEVMFGPVIVAPEKIHVMNNVYLSDYLGGGGNRIADPNDPNDVEDFRVNDGVLRKDAWVFPVPCTFQVTEVTSDITGHHSPELKAALDMSEEEARRESWPGASAWAEHWGFRHGVDPTMSKYDSVRKTDYMFGNGSNSRVSIGPSMTYCSDGKERIYEPGNCHLGSYIGPDKLKDMRGRTGTKRVGSMAHMQNSVHIPSVTIS